MFTFVLSWASGLKIMCDVIGCMNNNVIYSVILPDPGRKFPANPPKAELERILQDGFRTRNKRVLDEYFIEGSGFYPSNLSFVIVPYLKGSQPQIWIGTLVVTEEEVNGVRFTYYDKVTVLPPYQRNGVMRGMISVAGTVGTGKIILPSVLRTSDIDLSQEVYGKQSDIQTYIEPWHIHGFGFKNKGTGVIHQTYKGKLDMIAEYVALKPRTVVQIS